MKKYKVMKVYNVVFHRHYTVTSNDVVGWEDEFDTIEEAVEEKARDWMSDEMPEFVDNTKDFVSATIQLKSLKRGK